MKSKLAMKHKWGSWLSAAAFGAITMFFTDPNRGRRRRVRVRDKMRRLQGKTGKALDIALRDISNRLDGMQSRLSHFLFYRSDRPDDQVVVERARAKLGRVASHPHAIKITAQQGRIILRGPILESEKENLLASLRSIPGVTEVEDQLEVHEQPNGIPSLQGGSERQQMRSAFRQEDWTPTMRTVALLVGGTVGSYGILRSRKPIGGMLAIAGLALATRAVINSPINRLSRESAKAGAIDLHKTIYIEAPPETIFDIWANYGNFRHFMSHVLEVRDLGHQRSHWVIKGPGDIPIEWDAVMTESTRPTTLAWKSEPGAAVENTGLIRFEPSGTGTRVTIRLSYHPPAGTAGQGSVVLQGVDPKRELDDDLTRMKHFIESGIPLYDTTKPTSPTKQLLH